MIIVKRLVPLCLLLCFLSQVNAAQLLIENAHVYTGTGEKSRENTDILVVDGVISKLGQGLAENFDGKVINAKGKSVTPGLTNAYTHLGLVEISAVSHSRDTSTEDNLLGPSFQVASAVNPAATAIPHNRINGLIHSIVAPASGHQLFAGQAAAIRLAGDGTTLINPSVAMFAHYDSKGSKLSGGSRAATHGRLKLSLDDAIDYGKNRNRARAGDWREFFMPLNDLEALQPVVSGKQLLAVIVHRESDIRNLLELKESYGLNLVLVGATEAWRLADDIARAKVPVIMDPMANLPLDFDQLSARLDAASILHRSGVKMLFTGVAWRNTHSAHLVRQAAGNAAARGLPVDEAIRAMTLNPAEVFGFADKFGSIEEGKIADLVIWDGHPLELLTRADQVLINGKVIPMVSRSTRLRDRYRELDTKYPHAYRK